MTNSREQQIKQMPIKWRYFPATRRGRQFTSGTYPVPHDLRTEHLHVMPIQGCGVGRVVVDSITDTRVILRVMDGSLDKLGAQIAVDLEAQERAKEATAEVAERK
jgi:hypothetical protein